MVCDSRYLRCLLVVVCGLISSSAFAADGVVFNSKSAAQQACSAFVSAWPSVVSSTAGSGYSVCDNFCSESGNSYFFVPKLKLGSSGSCSTAGSPGNPVNFGSLNYTAFQGLSKTYSFVYNNDPQPDCPGPSAPEFTGWKAPTANGSGFVCIDGCGANIALQAPPLPLFSGMWTGETCTPSPSNSPEPASDPNETPCPPGDPQCPGTGEPSDPESPVGTGGGGFQCDSPPVCNADGVTCSMLYQQWRGRCEAEFARIENRDRLDRIGDSLDDGFSGLEQGLDALGNKVDSVGDKVDRVRQSVDSVGDKVGDVNQSIRSLHSDLETGFSTGGIGDPGDAAWGSVSSTTEIGVGDLDASGMGFPRVCPVFEDVTISFVSFSVVMPFSDFDLHCSLLEWLGYIIVAFSAFWAARILLDV